MVVMANSDEPISISIKRYDPYLLIWMMLLIFVIVLVCLAWKVTTLVVSCLVVKGVRADQAAQR